jgi:excisionase family DNA binding protein
MAKYAKPISTSGSVQALALSVYQAAAALNVSSSLVRLEIKTGGIKAFRIGGRVLVSRKEIDRLLSGTFSSREVVDALTR